MKLITKMANTSRVKLQLRVNDGRKKNVEFILDFHNVMLCLHVRLYVWSKAAAAAATSNSYHI